MSLDSCLDDTSSSPGRDNCENIALLPIHAEVEYIYVWVVDDHPQKRVGEKEEHLHHRNILAVRHSLKDREICLTPTSRNILHTLIMDFKKSGYILNVLLYYMNR